MTIHHWIGRRGHVEWSPRSPNLSPLVFLGGMLKEKVHSMNITDLDHMENALPVNVLKRTAMQTYSIQFT